MARGFIDSASVSQVVQSLDRGCHADDQWTYTVLTVVTQILIQSPDHWHIAPGVQPDSGVASDHQAKLIDGLAKVARLVTSNHSHRPILSTLSRRRKLGLAKLTMC